jgi:hypothetical protein
MKGISVWIWVIASFIMAILMFTISFQFITYITVASEREVSKENLDNLASNINGICGNFVGDSIVENVMLPEKVSLVYATKDIKIVSNNSRTYGMNLCMNFTNEIVCDNLNCNLEMETINNNLSLQSLLNQLLGRYGTNSYTLEILKTNCGVAVLYQGSQSTCSQNSNVNNTVV